VRLFFGVKGGASTDPESGAGACCSSADREHPQPSGDAIPSGGPILLKVLVA